MKHDLTMKGITMTLQLALLPVDATGAASSNLIPNELHQIIGGTKSAIRPNAGSFFKTTLQTYSVDGLGNLSPMALGTDYVCADLDATATAITGQEVYKLILLINPDLTSLCSITYQAYGGVDNINICAMYNAFLAANLGTPTPLSSLGDVPTTFPPVAHEHDIADVYGMEFVTGFLANLQQAISSTTSNAKYQVVTAAIANFSTALATYNNALIVGMREHVDNVAFPHAYTAEMIGLGNVSNYGFVPIVQGEVTLPAFASPATVVASLTPLPPYKRISALHPTLTDNPHQDSQLNVPGLSNIQNLDSVITYAIGTNEYSTLLAPTATQVYLGPYPAVNAIKESTVAAYAAEYTAAVADFFTPVSTTLTSTSTINADTGTLSAGTNTTLATIAENLVPITNTLTTLGLQEFTYALVNNNAAYAAVLEQLLAIEYSNFSTKIGVTKDGYYSVPDKLPNLISWLSANNPENSLFPDTIGNVRVIKLVDKAANRSFTALPNLAPILRPSTDKTGSVPGITNGNVLAFTNGMCLNLSEGTPIYVTPGMTIIALIKTGPTASSLQLLGDPSTPEIIGVFANTGTNQSLAIETSSGWVPMSTPAGGQQNNASTILISSISPVDEAQSWFASSNAFNATLYPRGVSTPATTWPTAGYIGDPLTQIGNANFGIANVGELAELLIYDRQLSGAEVKAVVAYLQLRYSLNTALSVDFAALAAF